MNPQSKIQSIGLNAREKEMLRDKIAILAMSEAIRSLRNSNEIFRTHQEIAEKAYSVADAMLKAREVKP